MKGTVWAIIAIALGFLIFLDGCVKGNDIFQYIGAGFIAIGIFTADFVFSEKKKVKE